MANIEDTLFSRLTNDSAVTAVLGSRFYPVKLPQGYIAPACLYRRIDEVPVHAQGTSATAMSARIQFDVFAKTFAEAKNAINKIRESLDALDSTVAGVRIYGILYISQIDFYEDDTELFRTSADFKVMYTQE